MPGKWKKIRGDKVKCKVCGAMIRRDDILRHRRYHALRGEIQEANKGSVENTEQSHSAQN